MIHEKLALEKIIFLKSVINEKYHYALDSIRKDIISAIQETQESLKNRYETSYMSLINGEVKYIRFESMQKGIAYKISANLCTDIPKDGLVIEIGNGLQNKPK